MRIDLSVDIKKITKNLSRLQKEQIPFAASKSLNQLAYQIAKKTMPQKTEQVFDRGAPNFTKRGFFYKPSSKRQLWTDVFIGKDRLHYMKFMVQGGTRFPDKRAILVATRHSRVNKYGNLTRNTIANMLNDKNKFFKGQPKGGRGLPEGIWERYGRKGRSNSAGQKIRLVALYTKDAQYKPIFPFGTFADTVVFSRNDGFAKLFRQNLSLALRTAR